jgi:hypothetical protein
MAVLMATRRFRWWWLGAFLCVVACVNLVPQQGWRADFGPVVPHDSFPADCSLCHTGGDWQTLRSDFTFDHAARTGVLLRGAHADAACLLCHNDRGPVRQFSARGCGGCHQDPHLGRLGANCQDCHDETMWRARDAIAQHDRTRFPLVGAHAAAACFRCHPGAQVGNFAGAYVECRQCHADEYARAAVPNHAAAGLPMTCSDCHRPTGWAPAEFAHAASFPLQQGHAGRRCSDCHTTPGSFAGLSTSCRSCHADTAAAVAVPNHAAAGFVAECDACHDLRAFAPANWPHAAAFPLALGHAGRRCQECHANNLFVGTASDCASCHLDTWQQTLHPNHALAGFPTTCQQCHSTARWGGATFNHPFPITSGVHAGLGCASCHTTPANPTAFSCIDCHDHNQAEMADEHDEVAGYVWASASCLACHPNGQK